MVTALSAQIRQLLSALRWSLTQVREMELVHQGRLAHNRVTLDTTSMEDIGVSHASACTEGSSCKRRFNLPPVFHRRKGGHIARAVPTVVLTARAAKMY